MAEHVRPDGYMKDTPRAGATDERATGAKLLLDSASERLPTPDGVALAIMEAWEDSRTTFYQLSQLVQTDPALSGRVLKLANSAAFSHRPVASVPAAIMRVGMQTVGQLAVAFSLINKDDIHNCPAFDHQQYWSRCLLMAVLSRGLGEATQLAPPQDLFACGLLARIGVLGLACVYPEAYSDLLAMNPPDLTALEKQKFSVDHNELSEAMMLDFCVPNALAEPARYHEAPERSGFDRNARPQKLVLLLHLAYRLSEAAVHGGDAIEADTAVLDSISARLGLAEGEIERISNDALAEWREWSKLLQLSVHSAPNHQQSQRTSAGQDEQSCGSTQMLRAVVIADLNCAASITASLAALNIRAERCDDSKQALRLAMEHQVNVFFVSPPYDSFIRAARHSEIGDASYIFAVETSADTEFEAYAYDIGADDVIVADLPVERLEPRLKPALRMLAQHEGWHSDRKDLHHIAKELALSHRQQEVLALTDQLTELPNRRAAIDALDQAWSHSLRSQAPCALLIMDIDHFKSINDCYGHAVGDQVLHATAAVLKQAVRRDETIARIGGEEFLLISTRLNLREAVVAAERLRRHIEHATIDIGSKVIKITVSIGIAAREAEMSDPEALMIAADKALYAAKDGGRNRLGFFADGKVRLLKQ